jgi:hypothetical protein
MSAPGAFKQDWTLYEPATLAEAYMRGYLHGSHALAFGQSVDLEEPPPAWWRWRERRRWQRRMHIAYLEREMGLVVP